MNCPLCLDTVLDVTFHAGIELDICPRCRGVWLDRGELDRIAQDRPAPVPADRSERAPGTASNKKRKKRKKTLGDRLGDVFEEVLDL